MNYEDLISQEEEKQKEANHDIIKFKLGIRRQP